MKTIRDREFRNETVVIDDTTFEGCAFDECRLIYRGGRFAFERCSFGVNTHELEDGAARVSTYMAFFGMEPRAALDLFR